MHQDLAVRLSKIEDREYIVSWLKEPGVLRWFPMCDDREIEDAVNIWMTYVQQRSALTVTANGIPCGMSVLYVSFLKKLSHQALFAVIVQKEFRNRGVGTFLLTELEKVAKEEFHLEVLHLEVYEGNPAQHLYKKLGFEQYGYQKNFIKEVDGNYLGKIFMQKKLVKDSYGRS